MSINTMADKLEALNDDGTITTDIPALAYAVYADNLGYTLEDFEDWRSEAEEAYQGDYPSDEEFAQTLADDLGIEIGSEWPLYCIDWQYAARELMYDYFEGEGFYFRNL